MRLLTLTAMIVMLTACGTTDVVTKPVEVDVPIGIPCKITPVKIPLWYTNGVTDKTPMPQQISALEATLSREKGMKQN